MSGKRPSPSISERHQQERIALNQVSQALQSTLDLEELLGLIHVQLTQLLEVNNFYVALLDERNERIWYPLAVKRGNRMNWAPRPLADRLTDRVIRERKPLLLTTEIEKNEAWAELPPSEEIPKDWIGVPMISPNRVVGCLALFSLSPRVKFSPDDIEILNIISSQISSAIENATLFDQVQRRAVQLEMLNRISAKITASLNPEEVLDLICRSVSQLTNANRSAIFLLSPDKSMIELAHSHNLSKNFVSQNQSFPPDQDGRTRCLKSGVPELIPNIVDSDLEDNFVVLLQSSDIQAFGDFPLSTPEGRIGFLSVYYEKIHNFEAEEAELLKTLAAQAAIAVENARLHARTDQALSQRVSQLSILESVGRELAAATTSDQLFQLILDYAIDATGSPWGGLAIYEPENQLMRVKANRGFTQLTDFFPALHGISGRAFQTQQIVNLSNVEDDPDYIDLTNGKARSQLSVPLIHEARVLGVITLESPEINAYSADDQTFVSQLANQAAIALINSNLFASVSQARDRLAAVLDSSKEGFVMFQSEGRVVLANQAIQELINLDPTDLIDKQLSDLDQDVLLRLGYSKAEIRKLIGSLERGRLLEGSPFTIPVQNTQSARILERLCLPVFSDENALIGGMIVLRDVTQEHEVAEARQVLTETLWHDLRSPLSTVLGAIHILEEDAQESKASAYTVEAVHIAKRGISRVLDMAETLLDISRMQSGQMEFSPIEVDLRKLAENVLKDFTPLAEEYEVHLSAELKPNLPLIHADLEKITRVLNNLVDNALKFTPPEGSVTIKACITEDGFAAISVCDTGPGIPKEYWEKIFERFAQVPNLKGRKRGTGLGLTFCRLAVEAHGGKIWLAKSSKGGSTFTFTLPLR